MCVGMVPGETEGGLGFAGLSVLIAGHGRGNHSSSRPRAMRYEPPYGAVTCWLVEFDRVALSPAD